MSWIVTPAGVLALPRSGDLWRDSKRPATGRCTGRVLCLHFVTGCGDFQMRGNCIWRRDCNTIRLPRWLYRRTKSSPVYQCPVTLERSHKISLQLFAALLVSTLSQSNISPQLELTALLRQASQETIALDDCTQDRTDGYTSRTRYKQVPVSETCRLVRSKFSLEICVGVDSQTM